MQAKKQKGKHTTSTKHERQADANQDNWHTPIKCGGNARDTVGQIVKIIEQNYVYWKNQRIEHYTLSWAYSKEAKRQAEELARRCKILEARGEPINTRTVVWQWQDTTPAEKG